MEHHTLFGGKVRIYKRERSQLWQCSTYLAGKNRRMSTGEDSLALAKEFAEDWYLELRGKQRAGLLGGEKTFKEEAQQFLREFQGLAQGELSKNQSQVNQGEKLFRDVAEVFLQEFRLLTQGERSPKYVDGQELRLNAHILPFMKDRTVGQVTAATGQEYRMHRAGMVTHSGKAPSRTTIEQEMVVIRQVLKTAQRHEWLTFLPDLSNPFRASRKISHRAWFSPNEYRQLYEATRARAKEPKKEQWRWECEQMHDFVLFMANTGLRPDEALRLEYRDVTIAKENGELILHIEVRGKTGVGYCKSTSGAVRPFQRLRKRNTPQLQDRLFPGRHVDLFNNILTELGLKFDREGRRRTAYSLRHSYICFRLMEGADIYQIAKNCRTSVEMIQKHYAAHIKSMLDASAINVRRSKNNGQAVKKNIEQTSAESALRNDSLAV